MPVACCCLLLLLFDRPQKIDFLQDLPKDVELAGNFGRYPGDVMVGHADAPHTGLYSPNNWRGERAVLLPTAQAKPERATEIFLVVPED